MSGCLSCVFMCMSVCVYVCVCMCVLLRPVESCCLLFRVFVCFD